MQSGGKAMIHIEFVHFSKMELYEQFERTAVRGADSVGMNE